MSTSVFEPVRELLEQTFKNGWVTGASERTPIKWDNAPFAQPANSAWVSFNVRWGTGQQVSIGPATRRLERHVGVIIIQVFTPKNGGTKVMDDHCDFAANLMRMQTIVDAVAGIEIEIRSPTRSFAGEEKELRQDNLSIEFQVDSFF